MHLYSIYNIPIAKLSRIRKIGRNAIIDFEVITIISGLMQKYSIYARSVYVSCENYRKWTGFVSCEWRSRIATLRAKLGVVFGNSQ